MNLKNRIARLEDRIGCRDKPCPAHQIALIVDAGAAMPEESEIPLCANCGRRGDILEIVEVIVESNADGELVEQDAK
jgi:hypothetical protein